MGVVVKTLKEAPDLRAQVLKLIEQHFPKGEPLTKKTSLEQEFFLLLDPSNTHNQLVAVDESTNTALATLSYFTFRMNFPFPQPLPLDCIGIGLVVTNQQSRLQGLSKLLQDEAESRAKQVGVALSILWSDLLEFYEKQGYVPCGQETQWEINRITTQKLKTFLFNEKIKYKVKPIVQFSEIEPIYKSLKIGPFRNFSLYQKSLAISDIWPMSVYDDKDKIRAYLVRGKGRDLRTVIHEIAGDEPYCLAGLVEMLESYTNPTKLLTLQIPHLHPVKFEKHLGSGKQMIMALMKVLRPLTLVNWIVQSQLIPKECVLLYEKGTYLLVKENEVLFSSEHSSDILQIFFGPLHPNDFNNFPPKAKEAFHHYQIPPLYFWGLDSV